MPVYKLFEEVSYYAIGFPIARYYSGAARNGDGTAARLKGLARDPFIQVAVSSLVLGALLNLSGVERPAVYGSLNQIVVPLATILLLASIGLALRFGRIRGYLRESLAIATIKFVLVPLGAVALARTVGFGAIQDGLPLKVVAILSAMPVAFNALIPPSIYDLDLDLANACWFVTTALLAAFLPVLLWVVERL